MLNGRNFLGKLSDSQVFHASETLGWMEVDVEHPDGLDTMRRVPHFCGWKHSNDSNGG